MRIWATDITDRKREQRALERLNRTFRTLSGANLALVRAKNERELLANMCRVLIDVGGNRMVWIWLAERDEGKTVRVAASAGYDDGYLERARVSWADDERGRGPTGTAIRTGEPQVNLNFETNPRMGPWRAEALKRGYVSSAALPLKDANGAFGALTIYAGEPEALGSGEIELFVELAADVTEAITAHRPYRAAKGLEAALAEIEAGKGRLYDPKAVDACVALFRNKGFAFQ